MGGKWPGWPTGSGCNPQGIAGCRAWRTQREGIGEDGGLRYFPCQPADSRLNSPRFRVRPAAVAPYALCP